MDTASYTMSLKTERFCSEPTQQSVSGCKHPDNANSDKSFKV